jgi:arylformamidase
MADHKTDGSGASRFIDISVPLVSGMLNWPGDPAVKISKMKDLDSGDEATVSRLDFGAHTGTHMDAPLHFLDQAPGMDAMPLDAVIGPCRVIQLDDEKAVSRTSLEAYDPRARRDGLLLKTRNSHDRWWEKSIQRKFYLYLIRSSRVPCRSCRISNRWCRLLVRRWIPPGRHERLMRLCLAPRIWIIEGLDLTEVRPAAYMLYCLPLKIDGGDGAPARAVLGPPAA